MAKSSWLLVCAMLRMVLSAGAEDSARVLTRDAYMSIVLQYHPVVRAAALSVGRAGAGVQAARGAFDPVIGATVDSKTLDGKSYYQYIRPELSIPTWYGVELIAGSERVRGERLNPEATPGDLYYAGAKLNVNSIGLDTRRAALLQAQALRSQSEAERRLTVNALLYDAAGAYYEWQRAGAVQEVVRTALQNARERLHFVRVEYEQGARPAIDTVEALAQVLSMEQQLSASQMEYANAGLAVANFLWLGDGTPVQDRLMQPEPPGDQALDIPPLEGLITRALEEHPKLASLEGKIEILSVERLLKRTSLAPKLSVKATALSRSYSMVQDAGAGFLANNSKLSAELRLPLLLREARGNYRMAGLKVEEAQLERDAARVAIENKIRAAVNQAYALDAQLRAAQEMVRQYSRLYQGERTRFDAGESTLFLLNARQNKVMETLQKTAELSAKRGKAVAEVYFAAGTLFR